MSEQSELDRMTKLCDELRLALARQREVNETLVKALAMTRDALILTSAEFAEKHGTKTKPGNLIDPYEKDAMAQNKARAALAAAREVK